jgi:hypothetical protein
MPENHQSSINYLKCKNHHQFLSLVLLVQVSTKHQGKIIDINTKETIPYANILINKSESIISMGGQFYTFRKQ